MLQSKREEIVVRSTRIAVAVVFLSLFFISCAQGEPFSDKTDIIYKRDGQTMPLEGTEEIIRVAEETFESITVEMKEGKITIPAKDIDRIEHFDAPADFNLGIGALQSKDFEQAVKNFDKVKDFPRQWIKAYVLFYKAEAMREWGVFDKQKNVEASKLYEKLLAAHPDNIFKAKAMLGSAIAFIQEEKHDEARGKLEQVKTELFGTRWESMADLWLARIHERGKNFGNAARIYLTIATRAEDLGIKAEAQIGEIRCLASQDKYDRAFEKVDKFVKENSDPRVLGSAWNVKGDCHMARIEKGGPDEIRKALLAYLRVIVVYFFDDRSAAEAAFKAGKCFERLKQVDRAIEQYKRAVETAGGGDWVKKAGERLEALK